MTTKQRLEAMQRAEARPCTFKLLERQRQELYTIQNLTGTALSEQIRRGIDLWIAKQRRAK